MSYLPLVGLPADTYENHGFVFHSIGDKYLRAVAEVALCSPVMIPSMVDALELDALLDHFDGIVITGAVSNVHPPYYGEQPSPASISDSALAAELVAEFGCIFLRGD